MSGQNKTHPHLAGEQILTLVRQAFADADLVSAQLYAGVHANLNYAVTLSNPPMDVAIKVYLDPTDQKPWKEVYLLRRLTSETGVPVPRVLHFDDSNAHLAFPWMLCTRLPGQPLSTILGSMDTWEQEAIGYEMGRYLGHIHQIPLDAFGEFFDPALPRYPNEREFVFAQIRQLTGECTANKLLSEAQASAIRQAFEQANVFDRQRACLIHGNFVPPKIIVERGKSDYHISGLVGFEHALAASPEQDESQLFNWSFQGKPTLEKGFLDGYIEASELGAQFWPRIHFYRIYAYLQRILDTYRKNDPSCQAVIEQLVAYPLQPG